MFSHLNPLPHLPKYKGPYSVGSTEYEIPTIEIASQCKTIDPKVKTIKFRIFYPTESSARSKKSIPWLPRPQKVWNKAYAEFMGMSEQRASWLSSLPSVLNYATVPAVQNADVMENAESSPFPVVIFSHGLGGNYNTYSALMGSLASCGMICVTPEHRDGSAPISLIKSSKSQIETSIPYQKMAHSPTVEVLNGRNAQLRTRLAELDLVYNAILQLNSGKEFTNYTDATMQNDESPKFRQALDLSPSKVTWAGHSFGSATMVQFIKSVYYAKEAPESLSEGLDDQPWDINPLYTLPANSPLANQITAESPMFLLDLWTMPLRGPLTRWLWERPLPCYHRSSQESGPNLISIMSAEFYKWPEMRNRTRAVLSENPNESLSMLQESAPIGGSEALKSENHDKSTAQQKSSPAEVELKEPAEPEFPPLPITPAIEPESLFLSQPSNPLHSHISPDESSTRTPSPSPSSSPSTTESSPTRAGEKQATNSPSTSSSASSTSNLPTFNPTTTSPSPSPSTAPAQLYLVRNSAHLSQSDFGVLFPNLTRYVMKALDPEKTIELNVRGIVAMLKGRGINVRQLNENNNSSGRASSSKVMSDWDGNDHDRILEKGFVVDRWESVPLAE